MQVQKWHIVVIDLQLGQYYILYENRPWDYCDELVRDWPKEADQTVPVMWPADLPLPDFLTSS